ncbi:MAG: RDD family protein [Gammaproteobacteria bacterium]|nr:RDD family protein [Gammaproteobacteria bacterium]MDP2140012.1 RDD family protein [Gammaproteobacteria bacterium]MDP2347828.1 RDD family protein [Gammaproteobacteria bacterium]
MDNVEYAGFWIRVGSALIDTVLMMIIIVPAMTFLYGPAYWLEGSQGALGEILFNYFLPGIAAVLFWIYRSATPGKMALRLMIVDAATGGKPSVGQLIGRYLAYYVSILPLFLGLIWVGIDRRKQGWHDKLAGTVVVRKIDKEPVRFENSAD